MSTNLKIDRHTEEAKNLRMFLFTLAEDAEEWFYSLPAGSITTWEKWKQLFLMSIFMLMFFSRKYMISWILNKMMENHWVMLTRHSRDYWLLVLLTT